MTHRITVWVDGGNDYDTAGLAMWVGHIIQEEGGSTIAVRSIIVEEDA